MDMINVQVRFQRILYNQIRNLAGRKQLPISEMVHRLVSDGVRQAFEEEPPNKIEALLELAGILDSGLTDLGLNHDEYIAQAIEEDIVQHSRR
jgi:hypothetical protein